MKQTPERRESDNLLELWSEGLLYIQVPLTTQAKKLVLVLAISLSMTEASIRVKDQQLKYVLSIHYPVTFKKSQTAVQLLLDSGSNINAMTPVYAVVLGLRICSTDVETQKIDKSMFLNDDIMLANF